MKTDERDVQGAGVTGSRTTDARLHTLPLTNSQRSRIKEDGARVATRNICRQAARCSLQKTAVPPRVSCRSLRCHSLFCGGKKEEEVKGFIWPVVEGTFIYLAGFDGATVNCADREAQSSCDTKVMFLDIL